jgi:hypothetical protein
MPQDKDIARVAAALRTPGLKYRNFGNEPVRPGAPAPAGHAAQANAALTNLALDTALGRSFAAPTPVEEPRPTMKLIAEAISPIAPAAAGPFPAAVMPAWPLLDSLTQPPVAAEPARGTLMQLFGGLSAPATATLPASMPASMPAPISAAPPLAAFASPLPATTPAGPFPAAWALQPPAAEPAGAPEPVPSGQAAPGLVPADRVTTPLAEVLRNLGRGGPAANPAFAGLRLPCHGPR